MPFRIIVTKAIPNTYLLTMAGALGIRLLSKTDLFAHPRHDSQVVEPSIHLHFRYGHQ